jgi:hypothetical protein
MKLALGTLLLFVAPAVTLADSVQVVAQDLRALSPVPFRYGVAQDLAENLLVAQSEASYASPESLELSIESVIRAIGIEGTSYVGFANVNPITWEQSEIAIDPNAHIVITPGNVATSEPSVWILCLAGLGLISSLRKRVPGIGISPRPAEPPRS